MYSFKQYLKKWNIPLITHVDTRAVVKRIRKEGTMQSAFSASAEPPAFTAECDGYVVKSVNKRACYLRKR